MFLIVTSFSLFYLGLAAFKKWLKFISMLRRVLNSHFQDVIGLALSRIGTYGDLNNQEQVVALIDEVINREINMVLKVIYHKYNPNHLR